MILTIEQLRELAKINMDEKCYSVYVSIIEPNVKAMMKDYLKSWKDLENLITRMTMRSKGAYKSTQDILFSNDDNRTQSANYVELSIYKQVDTMSLKQKITYLHEAGILGDSIFDLLDFLRLRRNKIHGIDEAFSDIERMAFTIAHSITFWTYAMTDVTAYPDLAERERMRNSCENQALNLLKELKEKLPTK